MAAIEMVPEHQLAPEYQAEADAAEQVQREQAARLGGHLALAAQQHVFDRPMVTEVPPQRYMDVSGVSAW